MEAGPERGLAEALSEVQALTEATYLSARQRAVSKRRQLGDVVTTLRLLCGTLHGLSLLVEELQLREDEALSQHTPPHRSLLSTLACTLDRLNQSEDFENSEGVILQKLRQLLVGLRTAAESDSYFALVLSLSTAGSPTPPSRPPGDVELVSMNTDSHTVTESHEESLIAAKMYLDTLLGDVAARGPDNCFSHKLQVLERDVTHPSYSISALRLPQVAERHWADLEADLKRLFDPRKTANFEQWVLEYARQQWPERFDTASKALSTTPLLNLMSVVSDSSLQTLHVAAALGMPSVCQWLISEADGDAMRRRSPLGMAFYCALLGPNALLGRIDDPMQLAVDMRPAVQQERTLQILLDAGALEEIDSILVGPSQDEHFCVATMSFLVCHALQAPALFLRIFQSGFGLHQRFVQLFDGDNAIDRYWPSQLPKISYSFLESVLPAVLDRAVSQYDSYSHMSLLADGTFRIIDSFGLSCAPNDDVLRTLDVSDEAFIDIVREAVQDSEVAVARRLIQDPRWDPNALITGKRIAPTSDSDQASPPRIKGTSLLHFAVESDEFKLVEVILNSRDNVDVHALNNNDQTPLMLSESPEILKILLKHGARTTDTDDNGRNVWHFAAANSDVHLIDCLNKNDEHRDENLRGLMVGGQTPIAQAVIYPFKQMRKQPKSIIRQPYGAMHMLQVCKKDAEYLRNPTPLLFLAAEWGSDVLASRLIAFGADANVVDDKGRSALHFLNASATTDLVQTLQRACDAPVQTADCLTPAETIFAVFNEPAQIGRFPDHVLNHPANSQVLDATVYNSLLTKETLSYRDVLGAGLWERFATRVLSEWAPKWPAGSTAGPSALVAVDCLIKAGALARYEDEHLKSGLVPVLAGWTWNIGSPKQVAPWLEDLIRMILHASSQTAGFIQSRDAVQCLKLAVQQKHTALVERLLDIGVSVHLRHDETSVLESGCQPYTTCDTTMFTKLLNHADAGKLNEVNGLGFGLLYRLMDSRVLHRDQKLKAVLALGCDPNMTSGVHRKDPALLAYIRDRQIDAAIILLEGGADPSATDADGLDAGLAAASRGSIRILERIRALRKGFDWGRRCTFHFCSFTSSGGLDQTTIVRDSTALHLAAYHGHAAVIEFCFLTFGHDVNAATLDARWRPLHFAALNGSAACVRTLLGHGADPTARDYQGTTPLMVAVRGNQIEAARVFLELAPKSKTPVDVTWPFVQAVKTGFKDMIKLFEPFVTTVLPTTSVAPQGADQSRTKVIGAVLEALVKEGQVEACRRVLELVDPSELDSITMTCGKCSPIVFALRHKSFHACRVFLEAGLTSCHVDGRCHRHFGVPPYFNIGPCHALHMAVWRLGKEPLAGDKAVITQLLSLSDWHRYPLSPMHCAALKSGVAAARLIVDHIYEKAEIYMELRGRPFNWPLAYTQSRETTHAEVSGGGDSNGSQHAAKAIVTHIVNQRVASDDFAPRFGQDSTPLLIAVNEESLEMVKFLIEHGADPDMPDVLEANTPLHEAASSNFIEVAKYLLEKGANHNLRNSQSYTPLGLAVVEGHLEMAKLLVEHGADLDVRDADGMGLLSMCGEKSKNPEMFAWLLSLGQDPYRRDKSEYTAIHDSILGNEFPSFVFNYGFDFSQVGEVRKGFLSLIIEFNTVQAYGILARLLRRLPRERALEMVNATPGAFVSPLCNAVMQNEPGCLSTLLDHGADIDGEGSAEGSALMTACAMGRLEAVKILVRRGAAISYHSGAEGGVFRNAVECAKPFPKIVRWLLVGRHGSQGRLRGGGVDVDGDADRDREGDRERRPWSGVHVARYELPGVGAHVGRRGGESSLAYAGRLDDMRKSLRGMVVRVVDL